MKANCKNCGEPIHRTKDAPLWFHTNTGSPICVGTMAEPKAQQNPYSYRGQDWPTITPRPDMQELAGAIEHLRRRFDALKVFKWKKKGTNAMDADY